ncbi:putative sodium-coupled neutral amino acid transporter 7 [Amphibalanus amphitrite]|uniref:Putative sodium-coupled neutral amino acid transporter 7 n=1 Tax=Amphibalanus amphitrite TaxID=1232801 RepID=A0A6A4W8E8_AMPAM|nr:putative sodium-coupled neutral amino acid transporter 7 [Amphibalanus amphitrite]KAF0298181.1 putative sodium-coupled neutral amino acid transporter 7 [Amphibalanus amphitrite]
MPCDVTSAPLLERSDDEPEPPARPATPPPAAGTSWPAAVFLIVNAALGAGLLNFPQAYDQAGGLAVALSVQATLLVFIVAALLVLAVCSDHAGAATYQDAVHGLLGAPGLWACSAAIALYCYGTCVTFLIVIRDQSDVVFSSLAGPQFCKTWYMSHLFTMPVTVALFVLPLCFSKRIDFLKWASAVGVAAIFYLDGLITVKYFTGGFEPGPIKHRPDTWTDVFLVMPTICFGYQCHVSVVPIYSCLRVRTPTTFLRSALTAIAVCVATYTVAGTFGYLTFGGRVTSDVLMSYNARDPWVMAGIVAIAVKTYTTYPILLFCGREAVVRLWVAGRGLDESAAATGELPRRCVVATLWLVSSVLLALVTPSIGAVIQLLGSLAALFIFVFPGLCLLRLVLEKDPELLLRKDRWLTAFAVALTSVGAFVFGLVLTQALEEDIEHLGPPITDLCVVNRVTSQLMMHG